MSFTLDLTDEQPALREKAHVFARDVIRPAAAQYDRAQEFPWPVIEEAARQDLYRWELYAQLSTDPTGLSLPILSRSPARDGIVRKAHRAPCQNLVRDKG